GQLVHDHPSFADLVGESIFEPKLQFLPWMARSSRVMTPLFAQKINMEMPSAVKWNAAWTYPLSCIKS
ncbi:MAG: hypothetical protein AAGA36_08770, partial [Pseudomonadota bacterium]